MSIRVGGNAVITGTFKDAAGALADPTTVVFRYLTADGTTTTLAWHTAPEVVRVSLGTFEATIALTVAGRLDYEWVAGGAVIGDDAGSLRVAAGLLQTTQLTTTSEVDALLARAGTATSYTNAQKNDAIDLASQAFEQATGVAFASRERDATVDGTGTTELVLPDPHVTEVTAATVDDTTIAPGDITVDTTAGAAVLTGGWTRGRLNVELTYTYGYVTTPPDVSHAVAVLAASVLKDGPYDDRGYGISDDGGSIRLLTAGVAGAVFSIPEVEACADRYRIPAIA